MAASTIKGLTIEINGDTTALDKALSGVNKTSKNLQSELRQVDKLLKLDPSNTELLAQKQKLLADAVSNAKSKLDTLKTAANQASKQLANGDIGEDQYRALQREVIKAEQNLKSLESQARETGDAQTKAGNEAEGAGTDFQKAGKKAKDAGDDASKSKSGWGDLEDGMKSAGKVAAATSAAIVAAAGAAAVSMGSLSESTMEYRSDLSKLEQNAETANVNFENMKDELSGLTALTGETDSSIEALSNLMATGFNDAQITEAVDSLSGAVIKFPDTLKIESLADSLQETIATGSATGQFSELIGRLGGNVDDFNASLAAAATEAEKQQIALDWLANSGLSDVNAQYQEANEGMLAAAEAEFKLNDAFADLADVVDPTVATVKGGFADVVSSFADMVAGGEGATEEFSDTLSEFATSLIEMIQGFLPTLSTIMSSLIPSLINGIVTSLPLLVTAAFNIISTLANSLLAALPSIVQAGIDLIIQLANGIAEALPTLVPTIVDVVLQIATMIYENLPTIINAGLEIIMALIEGIIASIPILIEALPELIDAMMQYIAESLPMIIDAGIDIVIALIEGLVDAIPALVAMLPKLITSITTTLTNPESITKLLKGALQIIVALAKGLVEAIPTLVKALPSVIAAIVKGLGSAVTSMATVGLNLIKGLWNGIGDALGWLKNKILGLGNSILGWIKGIFGIHSPSSETAYFGEMLARGLGVGFIENMDGVAKSIGRAANTALDAISPNLEARLSYATASLPMGSSAAAVSNSVVNNSPVVNVTINTSGGLSEGDIVNTVNRALGKVFA